MPEARWNKPPLEGKPVRRGGTAQGPNSSIDVRVRTPAAMRGRKR
jgi:hypothetical protein